ncbi:hypothetical protein JW933_01895 [candidate division FCPU426 bacterium]|nr:hypothetical protein [candidate division FCPU426 bacterium]
MNGTIKALPKTILISFAFLLCVGYAGKANADYVVVDENAYRIIQTWYYDDDRPYYRYRVNYYGPQNERVVRTYINTNIETKKITDTRTYTSNYTKYELHDTAGNPYRYVKYLAYGPAGHRTIQATVIVNASTGLYSRILEQTAYETRNIYCNTYGLPYYMVKIKNYGPAYDRQSSVYLSYNVNTELPTYIYEISSLGRSITYFDANGLMTSGVSYKNYGLGYARTTNMTYVTSTSTGLPTRRVAVNQLETSTCYYNSDGAVVSEVIQKQYGPVAGRTVSVNYSLDANSGLIRTAVMTSSYESRQISYNSTYGVPVSEIVIRNYGPAATRQCQRSITSNLNTGLPQVIVEQDAMRVMTTYYDQNGCKTSAVVNRNYGLAGTRQAQISYSVNSNTGIITSAVEQSSMEIKQCSYDANGFITQMQVQRNYGPVEKRNAQFYYQVNSQTGLVSQSVEQTAYEVKVLYYNSNGIPTQGQLQRYTGPANMRNFQVTISTNSQTGLYQQEIYQNDYYRIELNYDQGGVPVQRRTYERSGSTWVLISQETLQPGDEVGMTEIIAAAAQDVENRQNDKKIKAAQADEEELPPAQFEYEKVKTNPVPIAGQRIGIPMLLKLDTQ